MKKVFMTICAAALAMSMSAVTPQYGIEFGYDHGSARVNTNIPGTDAKEIKANFKMDGFHIGGNVQLDFMDGKHIPSLVVGLNYQFLQNDLTKSNKVMKEEKKAFMDLYNATKNELKLSSPVFNAYITMHTIQLPIRAQYAYQINDDFRVFAFTGPQLRFHVALQQGSEISEKIDGKKDGEMNVLDMISGREKAIEWADGKQYSEEYLPNYSNGTAKIIINANGEKSTETIDIDKEDKDGLMPCFDLSWGFGVGCAWKNLSLNISYDLGLMNIVPASTKKMVKELNQKYVINPDALAVTLGYRF